MSKAEWSLRDLAESSRRARTGGYVVLGIGAALAVGGIVVVASVDESEFMGGTFKAIAGLGVVALGTACGAGGAIMLMSASGPERRYASVRDLPDPVERERASRTALVSLARSGKTKRLILGGLFTALAGAAAVGSDSAAAAALAGGLALYQFLSPSREEKAYRAFLATEEVPRENVSVGLGPGPRGGLLASLTVRF